jgi:hypothetical protein
MKYLAWIPVALLAFCFYVGTCHAARCGFEEIKKMDYYSDMIVKKRDALNRMSKGKQMGKEMRALVLLLSAELHSLYLVSGHMKDMIVMFCDTINCKKVNLSKITKQFEIANMGFYGLEFNLLDIKRGLEASGHVDLASVCDEYSLVARELGSISSKFYGRLYEMRGEPTPPSP